MRITHIITSLDTGGAEMMLFRLLSVASRSRFTPEVVTLKPRGPVAQLIEGLGVPVYEMGFRGALDSARGAVRLGAHLRRAAPDVIQTWMYHADLIGGVIGRLAGSAPVCWGLHNSTPDPSAIKPATMMMIRGCAALARCVPAVIVSCSRVASELHVAFGYPPRAIEVIPNGIDLDVFQPDPHARVRVRRELGIGDAARVVGSVGRYHPQKDYANFVAAAALLRRDLPDIQFVLCGDGLSWDNRELAEAISRAGIAANTHLLGRRSDVAAVYASFDVMTLSSAFGEAFPMVIGEAMACGTPCVATDLGDTAELIGTTGRVVPIRDPEALARAWRSLLTMEQAERRTLGEKARDRVARRYSLQSVSAQYESVWLRAMKSKDR